MRFENDLKSAGKINKVDGNKKAYQTFMSHVVDNKVEIQETKEDDKKYETMRTSQNMPVKRETEKKPSSNSSIHLEHLIGNNSYT